MKKRIYIASDGGGTKLELGAVSADGELICRVRVPGGINRKTNDADSIGKTIRRGFDELRTRIGDFETAGVAGYLMHNDDAFSRIAGCPVTEVNEGTLGLYAAGIYGDGILILSGTGADAYVIKDGEYHIVGGYGAILGDPGSGFAIGRAAINAAVAYAEGRGEATLLLELLREKYPSDTLRGSVYGIYETPQTARNVADFCKQCEIAADRGDRVALEIFKRAAHELSAFALAGAKIYSMSACTPYTFAGGVMLHDLTREKPLLKDAVISDMNGAGMYNYVPPEGSPLDGAVKWIERNMISNGGK